MHLHNPLQAANQFCSFHSVTPLPHTAIPNYSVKGKQICLRSLLPFRCIPFGWSLLTSAPDPFSPLHLHSISHLSMKSKSASHPCLLVLNLTMLLIQHSVLFYKALSINPKNKKESKGRGAYLSQRSWSARLKCIFEKKSPPLQPLFNNLNLI